MLIARGRHSEVILDPISGIACKRFFREFANSFNKELKALSELENLNIAPKLYDWDTSKLTIWMEYLVGPSFDDLLKGKLKLSGELILEAIRQVLYISARLDKLGIQKEEMHRPFKHVILVNLKPLKVKLIDFDRAYRARKPSNLTGFLSFLIRYREPLKHLGVDTSAITPIDGKLYRAGKLTPEELALKLKVRP